ncbi:UNVERIFIED_CONTAM: hypothetical protein HDU68_011052 [Siphonaria sp. JEL0065]|nr:hypothetical protein HDU68_011052 [Siphonaria sp. JEL0065]
MEYCSNSIVVISDPSCSTYNAIQTAVNNLSFSAEDGITIINILDSKASIDQQSSLLSITTCLQSMKESMHPLTSIKAFCIPESSANFENKVRKLVLTANPQLMILALSPAFTELVYSYIARSNSMSQIQCKHLDAFEAIVPDERNEGWCIQDSPRCSSPVGWD